MSKSQIPRGNEDTNMVCCTRCGFPCDLSRDKQKQGHGYSYFTLAGVGSQAQYPDDWAVAFGCPQCGKGDYNTNLK